MSAIQDLLTNPTSASIGVAALTFVTGIIAAIPKPDPRVKLAAKLRKLDLLPSGRQLQRRRLAIQIARLQQATRKGLERGALQPQPGDQTLLKPPVV